jgi:hypothetical protein
MKLQLSRAVVGALVLTVALFGCDRHAHVSPSSDFDECENVALLNDYETLRSIRYHRATKLLTVESLGADRVIVQASIDCSQKRYVAATNYPPGHKPRSALFLSSMSGRERVEVGEGINGVLLSGDEVFVVTAMQRRAPVDPRLGALSRKEVDPTTREHLFTELLVLDNRLREKRRLRYPMPAYEWITPGSITTLGASVLRIDLRTGERLSAYDFGDAPDFPFATTSFHYIRGTLFAVTGSGAPHATSVPLGTILRLDEVTKSWQPLTRDLPKEPTLALDDGRRIIVFGSHTVSVFDESGSRVANDALPVEEGLQVRAAAVVDAGVIVLLMRPDKSSPGVFLPEATLLVLDHDLKFLAASQLIGVGNAPMLTSSLSVTPSGGRHGFLGPLP